MSTLKINLLILLFGVIAADQIPCQSKFSSSLSSNFFVCNCIFCGLQNNDASSGGGAICINNYISILYVSQAIFDSCFSVYVSGAVDALVQQISISLTCGIDCTASYSCQFMRCSTSSNSENTVSQLSNTRCSNSSQIGKYYSFYASTNDISMKSVNSSYNTLSSQGSAFLVCSTNALDIRFTTAFNGTTYGNIALYFGNVSGSVEESNIISNTQTSGSIGFIHHEVGSRVLTVNNCVIANNVGGPIFEAMLGASIIATNCFISHFGYSVATTGASITDEKTISNSFDFEATEFVKGVERCVVEKCVNCSTAIFSLPMADSCLSMPRAVFLMIPLLITART